MLEFCEAAGIPSCVVTLPVTETVEDLVDLVEYAFGDAGTTKYGALRASDGRRCNTDLGFGVDHVPRFVPPPRRASCLVSMCK